MNYELTVLAGDGWAQVVKRGQHLRIIDLEGNQAVDTLFYNAHDHADHEHRARELAQLNGVPLLPGTGLLSSAQEALAVGLPLMLKSTAGGASGCGFAAMPMNWRKPSPPCSGLAKPVLRTPAFSPNDSSSARGTLRCRSLAMAQDAWWRWVSATVQRNGEIRK